MRLLLALWVAVLAAPAAAEYAVRASFVSAYDGDTLNLIAHPWPNLDLRVTVRVRGLDTPEIRGRCPRERELARQARTEARNLLAGAGEIVVSGVDLASDPYGRAVATVTADGVRLDEHLIRLGLARAYDGTGRRQGWCSPAP